MSVSIDVLKRFAPRVYLHAYDNHRPSSVEDYLATCNLKNSSGNILSSNVNLDDLVQHNSSSNYLQWKNEKLPNGHDDRPTGTQITDGFCRAPIYVNAVEESKYIDLIYVMFFPFSGFQTFRVGILDGFYTKKRNFSWARFARHGGDWEHVTVRISKDQSTLLGVYYSGHGKSYFLQGHKVKLAGTHPIVYNAWNTHANYHYSGVPKLKRVMGPGGPPQFGAGLLPVKWLDASDVTTNSSLAIYRKPSPFFNTVRWDTWTNVVATDHNPSAAKWLKFKGNWGRPRADNSHIDRPPSMPAGAHNTLFNVAKIAGFLGQLPDELKSGKGPRSPKQQGWWRTKEPITFLKTKQYGGPHGGSFDDSSKITHSDALKEIRIRTGKRVDKVSFQLRRGTWLHHGGGGGGEKKLTLYNGERITRIDICLGKKDGHTRLFFIRFHTNRGRKLEGGRKTSNAHTINISVGQEVIGMHGRSGKEVDKLGFITRLV